MSHKSAAAAAPQDTYRSCFVRYVNSNENPQITGSADVATGGQLKPSATKFGHSMALTKFNTHVTIRKRIYRSFLVVSMACMSESA